MSDGTQLVRYDAMCHAIAAAYEVDEVKDIRDKARAIEVYSRQAKNTEAERQACEIRLRAERKCGQLLRDMKAAGLMAKGGAPYHKPTGYIVEPVDGPEDEETLAGLKVTKRQSHDWQRLAEVPDEDFEVALQAERPTTSGIITSHSEPRQSPVADEALWLWGRLRDFERDGMLARDPASLTDTMLEHMQSTTRRLAPLVAAWLGRIAP